MPTQDMLQSEGPPYMCQVCRSGQIPAWPQYEAHLVSKNHIKKVFNLPMNSHVTLSSRMQSLGLLAPNQPAQEFQADDADFPALGGEAEDRLASQQRQPQPVQYSQVTPAPSGFAAAPGPAAASQEPYIDRRTQSERSGNVRLMPSLDATDRAHGMPRYANVSKSDSAQEMLRTFINGRSQKLPHQILNEYTVAMRGSIEYRPTAPRVGGNFAYLAILTIDGVPSEYEAGEAKSKQKAKEEAARLALNVIARGSGGGGGGGGGYADRSASPAASLVSMTAQAASGALPGDRYADQCKKQLDALLRDVKIGGVDKVAAIFLSDSRLPQSEPTVQLVALGTGSSVNDHWLEHIYNSYGELVIDSTAFVCAKRAFRIRLAQEVSAYFSGQGRWLEPNNRDDRLRLKPGLALHLLLSSPPDGDCSAGDSGGDSAGAIGGDPLGRHSQEELLRDKCGVLEPDLSRYGSLACYEKYDCSMVRTFGLEEAEDPNSLAVHCGSDKLLLCNYVGLQGGLLANFIEPVFLQSVDVAGRYSHANMARGFLCRLPRLRHRLASPAYQLVADPWLGRTSDPLRLGSTDPDTAVLSINWYRPVDGSAGTAEVIDGPQGKKNIRRSQNVTPAERQLPDTDSLDGGGVSRLSKRAALSRIVKLAEEIANKSASVPVAKRINARIQSRLLADGEYLDLNSVSLRALKCADYAQCKRVVFDELASCNRGHWASKNGEMDPSDFHLADT
uniref:DRBM domain-containing protein n=1 Tax=Macrostomum lignano TaxID=282301 RepID=A0A1I8H8C9_9PLAT